MRNNTKSKGPQRDLGKERVWREQMRRFEKSGVSVRAFCREIGVGEASFYFWRRELTSRDRERVTAASVEAGHGSSKRRQTTESNGKPNTKSGGTAKKKSATRNKETKPRPILTPVTIIDDHSQSDERRPDAAIELIAGDITIRVPPSATRESLVMILDVLEDRRC